MRDERTNEAGASVLDRPDTVARLFLGLRVPEWVAIRLKETAEKHFGRYVERIVPMENLHLTLLFFGDVRNHAQYLGRLKQALPRTFVPTVSITHIGRGKARDQLWAHVQPTPALMTLREALSERLGKIHFPKPAAERTFRPHIRLAQFYPVVRGMGLADVPISVTYAVREVYLYRSDLSHEGATYTVLATIPF